MHHVMIIWYLLIQASTRASRTPLMSTHASYRLVGERGGTRESEETQEQEHLEAPEPGEELQECPDHRPSMFEKGKHRSILSLPILANLHDILCLFYYTAFK